jgi:FkbM family methyltransferase
MNEKINREYVINFVDRNCSGLLKGHLHIYNEYLIFLSKLVPKVLKHFVFKLCESIHYFTKFDTFYKISDIEKQFSLDFLVYSLKNNVNFQIENFSKEDKKEIIKFVNNKLLISINENIPKKMLFDDSVLLYEKEYSCFKKSISKVNDVYHLKWLDKKYILPINHFEVSNFYHQYGLSNINETNIRKIKSGSVIDCGAFIGDSALIFDQLNPKEIICVEPSLNNIKLLKKTIELNTLTSKIIIENYGVGEKEEILRISDNISCSSINSEQGSFIKIKKIDCICKNKKVTLIKMDIEGYELEAINGAKSTIINNKPVLLISIYHTGKDFFEIVPLLKKMVPDYKFSFLNLTKTSPTFEKILLVQL